MPLVVLTGFPLSGKSTAAKTLETLLRPHNANIHIVTTAAHTKSPSLEKTHRASLMACIERILTRDNIVIVDAVNGIKGFRYQLNCLVKGLGTTQVTVWCVCTPEESFARNKLLATPHDEDIVRDVIDRYEEPDDRNRWDSPLFAIQQSVDFDGKIPEGLVPCILRTPALHPNQSTSLKPVADSNYISDIDHILKTICADVQNASKSKMYGNVRVKGTEKQVFLSSRGVGVAELGRIRRLFESGLNKLTVEKEKKLVADAFVDFLNVHLN